MTAASFKVGDWEVFPDLHRLQCGENVVEIEPRVMAVLDELAREPGRVVTRDDLHRSVWSDVMVTDDALNRCITQLRRVLRDDARAPRFIETISKRGYRLIAPVVRGEPQTAPAESAQESPDSAIEAHVSTTTLLGHRAEVVARDIDPGQWQQLVDRVENALDTQDGRIVLHREGVVLTATAVEARTRFKVTTRTFAAAIPFLTGIGAFLITGMLLYGRAFQAGHVVAAALLAGAAGALAAAPRRRRALDQSRAVIGAFAKIVRRLSSVE